MLLLLAAGGASVAATKWALGNRSRVEDWFKDLYEEFYTEVQEALQEGQQKALREGQIGQDGDVPANPKSTDLATLDDRYQRFMVERFDTLLGSTRAEQMAQLSSGENGLEVSEDERKLNRYIGAAVLAMGTAIVGFVFPPILIVTLGTAVYATMRIFKNGYNAIVHEHRLRMDVMGSLYFIGAFGGGFFIAGSFGLIAFYLSEKLVLITQDRSHQSLVNVLGQQPRTVWLLAGDVEVETPIEQVQAGDIVVIQAGQVVPVDGVIVKGIATVDQHMLTGESQPAEKGEGDQVFTSTLLMAGKVQVKVEKTGEETAAAQIGVMLNNTASYQASIVSRGEKVADKSVAPTMVLAVVTWPLSGYMFAVTVLGSAIGLNIKLTAPIAMLNFLQVAANNGILIKDGRSLELLREVDTVVFDKTGTLTLDQPQIARIHTCGDIDEDAVLVYAAAAEHRQTHPLARAILDEASGRDLTLPDVDEAQYEMGYGLSVRLDGHVVRVGSGRYMALEDIELPESIREVGERTQQEGHSLVMVAVDGTLVGAIEMKPTVRPEVRDVVRALRGRNLDIVIISGDQEEPTRKMAESLDIPHYFADTLPEDKASLVEKLQSDGRSVCFVGDGINDSISLKKANVSVSLRGASTAATDTAQVVLMGQGLQQLPFLFELSDEFDGNMRAGFAVAVGQGVIVIAGAMLAVVSIVPGTMIWLAGLLTGLGIAHLPLRHHQVKRDDQPALGPAGGDEGAEAYDGAAEPPAEPEALAAVEPEALAAAEPEPAATAEPEPAATAEPEPAATAEPAPAATAEPAAPAESTDAPEPAQSERPSRSRPSRRPRTRAIA